MKRLFEITNVAGDGNCGYYVFQKYLERHKKEKILSVTDFRMMTAEFLIEHTNELLADKRLVPALRGPAFYRAVTSSKLTFIFQN